MCFPVRGEPAGQPSSEGTPLPGATPAMGHPSNRTHTAHPSQPPVPQRHGTAWLDSHPAQRVASAVAAGHQHARQAHGGQPRLGRREDHHYHLFVHARFVLVDRL